MATLTTLDASEITASSSESGVNISSDGGGEISSRGVAYNTSQNPTISDNTVTAGSGIGSFTADLSGLSQGTTYYARAFATNCAGTAYGNQVTFSTINPPVANFTGSPTSGADAEAYGDLYQWGRAADGHQKRNSGTTVTLSSTDTPGHGSFILAPSLPRDWRSPQNKSLWQGVNGVNNPCPQGYRLPTDAELHAERLSWSSNNSAGAFASPLKLPIAGNRF